MKKIFVVSFMFVLNSVVFGQKKDYTILKVNHQSVNASAYKKMFNTASKKYNHQEFKENIKLLVDYHLKLNQAKKLGIDTLVSVKNELNSYKKDLITPFLTDKNKLTELQKEAYNRSLYSVRASHILIKIDEADTLKAYKKVMQLTKELAKGADFEKLAIENSEDPSVKNNKGDLGYFNVFNMVYPFENAAYTTPVGKISKIVRTKFGYHLIKVTDKIPNKGKVEVAHIMVLGLEAKHKTKIDSIYKLIQSGKQFDDLVGTLSEDSGSKDNLGKLAPFSTGMYPKSFEDVSFRMTKPGEISMPFTSHVGWHIVKFIRKIPVGTFEESIDEIQRAIKKDSRAELPTIAAYNQLAKELKLKDNKKSQAIFLKENVYSIAKDSMQAVLFTIGRQKYYQHDFQNYIQNRRYKKPLLFLQEFKNTKLKEVAMEQFEYTRPEYGDVVRSYREGLMIFELMKQQVWDVATNDPERLKLYYEGHKGDYQNKPYEDVKGFVQSDFQDDLSAKWLENLRANTIVELNDEKIKQLDLEFAK